MFQLLRLYYQCYGQINIKQKQKIVAWKTEVFILINSSKISMSLTKFVLASIKLIICFKDRKKKKKNL